ncbi:MAG: MFS transporter [Pseudomonadota bacterium]
MDPTIASHSGDKGRVLADNSKACGGTFLLVLTGSLYFAQGIPLGLIFQAFPALLREAGVALEIIAWVPALGLPWAFKFLWAPWVDTCWSEYLGRRRTWLLSMQCLMILAVVGLVMTPIGPDAAWLPMALLFIASLVSATQDIATDGLAAERLRGSALVGVNALSVGGMMAGVMVGGAGTLLLVDSLGYSATISLLVVALSACAIPVLIWREGPLAREKMSANASLLRGIGRPCFFPVLAVAGLYASVHTTEVTLTKLFLVDAGWRLDRIGLIAVIGGLAMIIPGCGGASWLLMKTGTWRSAMAGLSLCVLAVSIMMLFAFGLAIPSLLTVAVATVLGSVGLALVAVAIFTIAMRFSSGGSQTGTDVTLFKSANVVSEIVVASAVTMVAAKAGYGLGFGLGLGLFAIAITSVLVARHRTSNLDLEP